ncbi:hypothetical protein AgCh_012923 [Apium graveolens]
MPEVVWYKGQKYACAPDTKQDPPKVIPVLQSYTMYRERKITVVEDILQKPVTFSEGASYSLITLAGSEISFFKIRICQGIAFKDLYGGRYYVAASMYTLPNQPNLVPTVAAENVVALSKTTL